MKAIAQHGYGSPDALKLEDIDKPAPANDEVLVRVRAASVHPDVWHFVTGLPYIYRLMGAGLRKPRSPIPGSDIAGIVESVGPKATRFKPGDAVFGETTRGFPIGHGGAFAEYVAAPEESLVVKPDNASFEAAAAVPTSGLIAFPTFLRMGEWLRGRKVLVNGAGGGVGTIALQLAKAHGAVVTGVDRAEKLEMIRALGADHVVDYMREDFTRLGERYDLIFDIPGKLSMRACRRALTPDGKYAFVGHDDYGRGMRRWVGLVPRALGLVVLSRFVRHLPKLHVSMPPKPESLAYLRDLLASGKLTPHVDRTYPLAQVPEAIRYLARGNVKGKVVITI